MHNSSCAASVLMEENTSKMPAIGEGAASKNLEGYEDILHNRKIVCSSGSFADESCEPARIEERAKKCKNSLIRHRFLAFFTIIGAAISTSVVVIYLSKSKKANTTHFETYFDGIAVRLLESFNNIVEQKVHTIGSLALAYADYASSHNLTWPFVTMKDFHLQGESTKRLSDALYVACYAKVTEQNRDAYEQYVLDNFYEYASKALEYQEQADVNPFSPDRWPTDIIRTSQNLKVRYNSYITNRTIQNETVSNSVASTDDNATINIDAGIPNHIYTWELNTGEMIYDNGPGPYLPMYQYAPLLFGVGGINLNMLALPVMQHRKLLYSCLNDKKFILAGFDISPPGDIFNENLVTAQTATWLSFAAGKEESYEGDPNSNLFIPVFDSLEEPNRTVVAVVHAVIRWKTYFDNVLPESIRGVYVVLVNKCIGAYTYLLNGAAVVPLGPGDLHDRKFDYLEHYMLFSNIMQVLDVIRFGYDLDQNTCTSSVHFYPSQMLYDSYIMAG